MTIAELFAKLSIKPDKKSFDAADKLIGAVKSALLALVAVETGKFFAGMVEDTTEAGSKINDLSQSAGVSAETLQTLGFAAKQNSSNMEEMGFGLAHLSKNMQAVKDGNKAVALTFQQMGVSVMNADGSLRPVDEVFADIADRFQGMPDGAKKTAAAMNTLGRSGMNLIPLLNGGSEELAKQAQEARDLGVVMSDDAVHAIDDFGDAQDRAKMALQGVRNEAVVALLPTLKSMVDGLLAWIKVNRKLIAQKLASIIGAIAKGLKFAAKVVLVLIDVFTFLSDHIDVVAVALLSLGAAMAIFKVESIAAAIASGAAWMLANLPLVLLAALIAGVILLVEDIVTAFEGGHSVIADFFDKKFGLDFVDTMTRVAGAVKAAFTAVFDYLEAKVDKLIKAGEWLGDKLADLAGQSEESQAAASDMTRGILKKFGFSDSMADDVAGAKVHVATPQEYAAMSAQNAKGANGAPSIHAPVTIQVGSLTGSPEKNAEVITSAFQRFWDSQMRQAFTSAGGGK